MAGGDCGYAFQRSLDYIVYASKKPGGGFSTGICSPTRRVEDAAEDLKYFHQLADASPIAEIRVTAYDVHRRYQAGGLFQVAGLAGVRVTIDGLGVHEAATTDSAGRHIFSSLPPGEYKVDASLEGYALPDNRRPVRVHPKGCAEVPLPLRLDRRVSGRILTSDGLPASGVTIECVPTRPRHENDPRIVKKLARAPWPCSPRFSTLIKFWIRAVCYAPRVQRWPVHTIPDQNRSWHTILRTPNTKINSHRPELNQNQTVSSGPSIRFSKYPGK